MIPTVLILVFFAALLTYGFYLAVGALRAPRDNTDQEEFLWNEGYAFATLKVDAKDYDNFPQMQDKTKEEFDKLRGFSAIVCTRDHGDYISKRMEHLPQRDERTRTFTVAFGKALGHTVVERFIILYDDREIISDGFDPSHQYPVEFNTGTTLSVTQTINLVEAE